MPPKGNTECEIVIQSRLRPDLIRDLRLLTTISREYVNLTCKTWDLSTNELEEVGLPQPQFPWLDVFKSGETWSGSPMLPGTCFMTPMSVYGE